mgnify:FL=1
MEKINRHDMVKKIVDNLSDKKIVIGGNKILYKNKYHLKYTQQIVDNVLKALFDTVMEELENGNMINFQNYFSIKPELRKTKKARNVVTGEDMIIPERYQFKVKGGLLLKQACDYFNDKSKSDNDI